MTEAMEEEKEKNSKETGKISCHVVQQGTELTLPTSADGFPFVEEVIDVSTPLMMQPENWPKGFHLSLSLVRLCFSWNIGDRTN